MHRALSELEQIGAHTGFYRESGSDNRPCGKMTNALLTTLAQDLEHISTRCHELGRSYDAMRLARAARNLAAVVVLPDQGS